MLYALLYYAFEDEVAAQEEVQPSPTNCEAVRLDARLLPATTAVMVRGQHIIDGAIWRGKDDVVGIEVVEASCLDEALALAACSADRIEGSTACEIRPIATYVAAKSEQALETQRFERSR